jgi:DNA polymerase-3 subunit gamma/tau
VENTMSYLTKYRPQSFDEVVGQPAIVKGLVSALKKDASRAYLFVGPSGTGKTTLAYLAVDYLKAKDELVEIDAAKETGVDDMRTRLEQVAYRPLRAERKALIIDEVHMISRNSFTSMLKTLEAPPPWLYWFLCTTELGKIPTNIKTRCVKFELKPVSLGELEDLLHDVVKAEKLKLPDEVITLCAKEANGSPRQALANLAACSGAQDRKEAGELLLSAEGAPEAIEFVRALYNGKGWAELKTLAAGLKDMNAESIRQIVRAYGTSIVLNAKSEKQAGMALEVLDAFAQPCYSGDGITPILLACGRLTIGT